MSSRKFDNVIVFGPTGTVGGITAFQAHKRGAHVWLAMRDPSKTIDEIPAEVEKSGKFNRVKADLSDPASVAKAVQESGAKAAYIYLIHGTSDFMRGSLQALRDAGVESVVFLSSYSVKPDVDLGSIPQEEFIPFAHARVELAAEEVGFPYFTALRPAQFASNNFKNFLDRSSKPPKARHISNGTIGDHIAPEDIGEVSAVVLTERPHGGKDVIYLCGPELRTMGESWEIIKKITGRHDIDTSPISREQFVQAMTAMGQPPFVSAYLAKFQEEWGDAEAFFPKSLYVPAVENIKKYTGRDAMKFEDYVEKHKSEWQAV